MKNMTMKTRKAMVAFLMATTMVSATAAPALADTATVKVSIKTTGLSGNKSGSEDIVSERSVTVTKDGSVTALDALKAVSGATAEGNTETINDVTYHYQGILSWYNTQYGNYIPAVKMTGHENTLVGKVFGDNGTANDDKDSIADDRGEYFKLSKLTTTETTDMGVAAGSTWNNTVHKAGWLSEKDYNNYSGWMCIINNSTYNDGVDTVVNNGDTICLDYSMMMGLDLGFDSYVQKGNEWIQVKAW